MNRRSVLLTCEHASRNIPKRYFGIFQATSWDEHEIFDLGAAMVAQKLSQSLKAPVFCGKVSRLLVDLNRTIGHPKLHLLDPDMTEQEKSALLNQFYLPFRQQVKEAIFKSKPVLHLSIHSFTRRLGKQLRNNDIGLLYDPSRKAEVRFAKILKPYLVQAGFTTRFNYPYRGTSDGHTTSLRRTFSQRDYCGLEIEICNDVLSGKNAKTNTRLVVEAIKQAVEGYSSTL